MSKGLRPGIDAPRLRAPRRGRRHARLSELQGDNLMVLSWAAASTARASASTSARCCASTTGARWRSRAGHHPAQRRPRRVQAGVSTGAYWTYLCDTDLEVQRTSTSTSTPTPTTTTRGAAHARARPGLEIEKVYVGYWFWGRPSPDQLWADLQELCAAALSRLRPDRAEVRAGGSPSSARPRAA